MNQFRDIEEVYDFVNKNAYDLDRNYNLFELWENYKDHTTIEEEKQKAKWELDYFHFQIRGDKLFTEIYSRPLDSGETNVRLELNNFQKAVIENLKIRIKATTNPILNARYYHLLWKCPSGIKNNRYADGAFGNYVLAIETCYEHLTSKQCYLEDHDKIDKQIYVNYINLVALSNEMQANFQALKKITDKLIFSPKIEFSTKQSIIKEMLSSPKIFKPLDFEKTLSIFEEELIRVRLHDYHLAKIYFPTALQIAKKTKSELRKWHDRTGLAYLRLALTETQDDRLWLKQSYYKKAIHSFLLAKNINKKNEVEMLYSELKPKVKLPVVAKKSQIQSLKRHENNRISAEQLLKKSPEEIYMAISIGSFFPKYSALEEASKNKENLLFNFVEKIGFDKNKNILNDRKEEQQMKIIYALYDIELKMTALPYLENVLINGIKSETLTFENFIEFLSIKTWIGKPHVKTKLDGKEKSINWLGLLSPSILEFFNQIQYLKSNKYSQLNFVLCIDSLTLKFEGLMRDLCSRMKIPTSVSKQKGMQEVYIHNVLENDKFKELFNEDDLLLFNFIFASESKMNHRNNVAHCYYDYEDYHLGQMLLLIAALLRLAKHGETWKENEPRN